MREKAAAAALLALRAALALPSASFVLAAGSAYAQPLTDPMAPPSSQGAATISPAEAPRAAAPQLQGVIVGPTRRLALINGAVVPVGEKVPGDGVLVGVAPDSATVRVDGKRQQLRLNPDVVKKEGKR